MLDSTSAQFHAARIDCALQERTIGHPSLFAHSRWMAFYLESGTAIAQTRDDSFDLSGPAILWAPLDDDTRLKIGAGSIGNYLLLSDRILGDAIGTVIEAAELRLFAQQPVMMSLNRNDPRANQLDETFTGIISETGSAGFGAEIAISAYVRLLLVRLWRGGDIETSERDTIGHRRAELSRFRNLVEAHFRARWKATQYADALGLTYDRLHDLCVRTLGKPPALIVRERSFHEAQILLQRTSLSADRISAILGFSSASQFNHFYKSMSGETPGTYRRTLAALSAENRMRIEPRFSDWP